MRTLGRSPGHAALEDLAKAREIMAHLLRTTFHDANAVRERAGNEKLDSPTDAELDSENRSGDVSR